MLETIVILLLVLWGFGYWGPYHANLGNLRPHPHRRRARRRGASGVIQGRRVL